MRAGGIRWGHRDGIHVWIERGWHWHVFLSHVPGYYGSAWRLWKHRLGWRRLA